jgi:hypothetical protein
MGHRPAKWTAKDRPDYGHAMKPTAGAWPSCALVTLAATVSCTPQVAGRFASDAYYEERFPVRAEYADPTRRQVPSGEWLLLNYQLKNGLPSKPKVTGDVVYQFDKDGDGDFDIQEKVKEFSLSYRHERTGSEMWMFLEPVSFENAKLDLDVIAANHVEASSGSGTVAASIAPGVVVAATRKFATRVLDGRAATIDGFPAYVVTYEIANVDQLSLSQESRWRRARVLYVRTTYRWVVRSGGKDYSNWPVLAVVGYDADPKVFETQLPDYGRFVGALRFLDDSGLVAAHGPELVACAEGRSPLRVDVDVRRDGTPWKAALDGSSSSCATRALGTGRFAPTGEPRHLTATVLASVPRGTTDLAAVTAPLAAPATSPAQPPGAITVPAASGEAAPFNSAEPSPQDTR